MEQTKTASIPSPDSQLSNNDPGDDIQRRFRYQNTYAAIIGITMLELQNNIVEFFCELHDDLLIKHSDGLYTAIQVKTRNINLPPFNITDDAIVTAFIKFVQLDLKYPGQFQGFSIVSNTGFDTSKKHLCIQTMIDNCVAGNFAEVTKPKTKNAAFINKLGKRCGCEPAQVIATVKRIRLKSFATIEDIHSKLLNELRSCSILKGTTESKLEDIADLLLARFYKASSKLEDDVVNLYILGVISGEDERNNVIAAKCSRRDDLLHWLAEQRTVPVILQLKDRNELSEIPRGYTKLEIKMDAGNIDADNISLIKNFKFSFESHVIEWLHKRTDGEADNQYGQVMAVVQNTCQEEYDNQRLGTQVYGLDMLQKVRARLSDRKRLEPGMFFDCSYEHLLGAVGVLTEQCKVWWSEKFLIEND